MATATDRMTKEKASGPLSALPPESPPSRAARMARTRAPLRLREVPAASSDGRSPRGVAGTGAFPWQTGGVSTMQFAGPAAGGHGTTGGFPPAAGEPCVLLKLGEIVLK